MRTFEFRDAKSYKFWNVELQGQRLTVTYGRIGAKGQEQVKEFPTPGGWETPIRAWSLGAVKGKAFVDLQNDVTLDDVRQACAEGYDAPELLKRYTTLGMATDQGRTSAVNALAVIAEARDRPLPEIGVTTFRPPFAPVADLPIGVLLQRQPGQTPAPIPLPGCDGRSGSASLHDH